MRAYLIRHAHAGHRSNWDGPDEERPLSSKGKKEAEHLTAVLDDQPVGRILSSPAVRCVETVEPLARARGLDVEVVPWLAEGSDPVDAIERMSAIADEDPVLCSHGDLIPDVIRLLRRRGMEVVEDGPSKKGSYWTLEGDDRSFTKATYHPPGG